MTCTKNQRFLQWNVLKEGKEHGLEGRAGTKGEINRDGFRRPVSTSPERPRRPPQCSSSRGLSTRAMCLRSNVLPAHVCREERQRSRPCPTCSADLPQPPKRQTWKRLKGTEQLTRKQIKNIRTNPPRDARGKFPLQDAFVAFYRPAKAKIFSPGLGNRTRIDK